jgi:glucoamylase
VAGEANTAFGAPGAAPRWTQADKDGVGTAPTAACRVWFTLWRGALTEIYYPTVDRAQVRDLQLVFTDGESYVHQERIDFDYDILPEDGAPAYRVTARAGNGGYSFEKTVICDPRSTCVLQRVDAEIKGQHFCRL